MSIVKINRIIPTLLFDDYNMREQFNTEERKHYAYVPGANIVESNENFIIEIAAPGLKKEDFAIELHNDLLNVTLQKQNEFESPEVKYLLKEFYYTTFKRSFHLPKTIDTEKIEAKYVDGILLLTIPKKEELKRNPVRTIQIS